MSGPDASAEATTWRLVLDGGYPDGVWACIGCGAALTAADLHGTANESVVDHRDGCPELARIAAAEREQQVALNQDAVWRQAAAAVRAERERIRQLAIQVGATYPAPGDDAMWDAPFADLLADPEAGRP